MQLTIATAGHIDHGKSALVAALTGTHPDRLPEEQARGISIELGFAHTTIDDAMVSFVDVPGHERFVRTMLAGVGGIDAVLLVVAADESVMPQTREHVDICHLLGVPVGVVALSRCDLADDTMIEVARQDVQELLAGTALCDAPIIPVSAQTGDGLPALREALVQCAARRPARDDAAPPRLPIDRVFTMKGFGTVVTGTLWTGTIAVDDVLQLLPAGREVRARGLQVHGERQPRATAGQRVALNVAGVPREEIARGDVLAGDCWLLATRVIDVDLALLPAASALRHGSRVHVHLGTADVLGRVLLPPVQASDDAPEQTREIAAGQHVRARLRLEAPLPARRGDRLVLRTYSPVHTIAGATVIDPSPPRRRDLSGGAAAPGDLATPPLELLVQLATRAGAAGLAADALGPRVGATHAQTVQWLAALVSAGTLVACGERWADPGALHAVRTGVLEAIDEHQRAEPHAGGIPRATLRSRRARAWDPQVVDRVIADLVREGIVVGEDRLERAAQAATAHESPDRITKTILEALQRAGLQGPTLVDLEGTLPDIDRKTLETVLQRAVRQDRVVRLGTVYFASEALARVPADLRTLAQAGAVPQAIDVAWFKQRYGLTRRTAIPVLEWLDRTRVTRRVGDARVLIDARRD